MEHKIRKQVMDLTINSRLDAFRTQHLAGHYYYRSLLPALEKIFNTVSDSDEILRMEKLEIDLGILTPERLEAAVIDNDLTALLQQQIREALQRSKPGTNLQRIAREENICRQWLYYMQHGHLNWNAMPFEESAYKTILTLLATDYGLVNMLRGLIWNYRNVRSRIVREHPETFLVNLAEILTAMPQQELPALISELVVLFSPPGKSVPPALQIRYGLWQQVLHAAARSEQKLPANQLIEVVLLTHISSGLIHVQEKDIMKLKKINPIWRELQKKNQQPVQQENMPKKIKENKLKKEDFSTHNEEMVAGEQEMYLSNAGLVLVHPFLSTIFSRLDLLAGNQFRDAEALAKALRLLHYIATGHTNVKEYELAVPKILCNVPVHQSPEVVADLREEEKQEAETMLLVIIEKWEKLKNISVGALRENFLQRSGKLYTKNNTRYLQIENSSLDVLLDFLPWTLSMIKLPWMKELLRVEWR